MKAASIRIGELADAAGVNPKTVRYYESIGLLPAAERTSSGYRMYSEDDLERVRFIKAAQSIGLALDEIKEILGFRERAELPCPYVVDLIARHAEDLDRRIRELDGLRSTLHGLEREARRVRPEELDRGRFCHIIEDPALRRGRARPRRPIRVTEGRGIGAATSGVTERRGKGSGSAGKG